jgi:hypothetical protein
MDDEEAKTPDLTEMYDSYLKGNAQELYRGAAPGASLGGEIGLVRSRLARALLDDDDAQIGARIEQLYKLIQLEAKMGGGGDTLSKLLGTIREQELRRAEQERDGG